MGAGAKDSVHDETTISRAELITLLHYSHISSAKGARRHLGFCFVGGGSGSGRAFSSIGVSLVTD